MWLVAFLLYVVSVPAALGAIVALDEKSGTPALSDNMLCLFAFLWPVILLFIAGGMLADTVVAWWENRPEEVDEFEDDPFDDSIFVADSYAAVDDVLITVDGQVPPANGWTTTRLEELRDALEARLEVLD